MSIQPTTSDELATEISAAADKRIALSILGRSSKLGWGHAVEASEELSVRALTGVLDYQPSELYMTALAGTPIDEIDAALGEYNQQLAFEPCIATPAGGKRSRASIGGVFACNLSGPRRLVSGAARDHLLGFEAITGFGQKIRSGGTVVKNVTGYDLSRLMCGSFGTLAVLTSVSFRVMPIAKQRITLAITGPNTMMALERISELAASALQPSGLCWLAPGPPSSQPTLQRNEGTGILLIRLEGLPRGTKDRASRLRRSLGDKDPIIVLEQDASDRVWCSVRDLDDLKKEHDDDVLLRASLPPASAPSLAEILTNYPGCRWLVDHAGGTFWVRIEAGRALRVIAKLRAALTVSGGALSVVDSAGGDGFTLSRFGPLDSAVTELNARIKAQFDPCNILNPGKLAGAVAHADSIQ